MQHCRNSENEENATGLGITEFFLRCIAGYVYEMSVLYYIA